LKKYLLISEVEELLGLSQSSLRYIERKNTKINIIKIRGRRYYRAEDLKKISDLIGKNFEVASKPITNNTVVVKADKKPNLIKVEVETAPMSEKEAPKITKSDNKSMQLDMFSVIEKIKNDSAAKNEASRDLVNQRIYLLEIRDNLLKFLTPSPIINHTNGIIARSPLLK
jgi:hypothetical protein